MRGPCISEQTYDVSSPTHGRIQFTGKGAVRSLIIDFMDDAQGNAATGTLAVYIGEATGGLPWATVKAGSMLCRPFSHGEVQASVTVIPSAGATGLAHLSFSAELLPPGRY